MFQSVAAAASANDGAVIGVDVDQSGDSETVITSAMKGLADSVVWALDKVYTDSFAEIGGVGTSLGVADDAVALPEETWSMTNFSVDEYKEIKELVKAGEIEIDANAPTEGGIADVAFSNVTVLYQ